MGRTMVLLFVIPAISIAFIALYQVVDEMFKKKFVLERRAPHAVDAGGEGPARRRYSDKVAHGRLRYPETAGTDPDKDATVPQVHGA